tara:strand:- start:76 stop:969 length:894 start_codon:yes stop_codon:yes gene_type:complete
MKGIIPSLNTPFSKKGSLDHTSLAKLVKHTIKSGCSGMLGLAVAGESQSLSFEEKIDFIEIVNHINKKRIPFIVSISNLHNEYSIKLSKIAKKNNALGVCIQIDQNKKIHNNLNLLKKIAKVGPEIIMIQDLDWNGNGLSKNYILKLFDEIDKFRWLKIETKNAGPKYTKIKRITKNKLNVCGGWAVTQLLDALNRDVDAFIPTGLEYLYVKIYKLYKNGNLHEARNLFHELLPVINFSNQNIDISIKFFKIARVKEKLFSTSYCRNVKAKFDEFQKKEAIEMLRVVKKLTQKYIYK